MQKTKVALIYWGLSLFIFLALIPWIFNPILAFHSIQVLAIYGGIVVAFLGGMIWGWESSQASSANIWCAIGFSLLGFGVALASFVNLPASLILLILSLLFVFEVKKAFLFLLFLAALSIRDL